MVEKNAKKRGVGLKNHENLPTSEMDGGIPELKHISFGKKKYFLFRNPSFIRFRYFPPEDFE